MKTNLQKKCFQFHFFTKKIMREIVFQDQMLTVHLHNDNDSKLGKNVNLLNFSLFLFFVNSA